MKILLIASLLLLINGCNQLDIRPDKPELTDIVDLQQQADKAYQAQDWPTAERAYSQLSEKVPKQVEPWFRLGNIYARTDRLDAAVAAYRNALLRDSKNGKIWHNLGIVHLRQATTTFIDMLENTREDDPLNDRARYVVNAISQIMENGFDAASE
ncbi:MAG TPA: tetratricopeptide repeat protein [Gammaproteobacteria bacterium]|nr:tetratricopeptide repeat protein [Gammaproteobacteria bacterium]